MSEDFEMYERRWLVPADHPYCLGGNNVPSIYKVGRGWKIAWRSFDSMKQDDEFATEAEARAAARRIAEMPVVANAYDERDLQDHSEFWLDGTAPHSRFKFKEITQQQCARLAPAQGVAVAPSNQRTTMTKQEQFLWIVQTTMLANNVRLATDPDTISAKSERDRSRRLADFSATVTFGLCTDAIYASERIPASMSAADAAHDWVFWMLTNLRDDGAKLPAWFARG